MGMAVLLITHDMGVVAEVVDKVLVMRHGKKVEEGAVEDIFREPRHSYTRAAGGRAAPGALAARGPAAGFRF